MPIRLYILGDSTAQTYAPEWAPQEGWGQEFQQFFDPEKVEVVNKAIGARSSKSFIYEGRLREIEMSLAEGDYMFIQFAHNDEANLVWRHTRPFSSYTNAVSLMIDTARLRKAIPVLLTSINQRVFDEDGNAVSTQDEYVRAVRALAVKKNCALIDAHTLTMQYITALGDAESRELYMHLEADERRLRPEKLTDNTHTREHGAYAFARLIANAVRESDLGISAYVNGRDL